MVFFKYCLSGATDFDAAGRALRGIDLRGMRTPHATMVTLSARLPLQGC